MLSKPEERITRSPASRAEASAIGTLAYPVKDTAPCLRLHHLRKTKRVPKGEGTGATRKKNLVRPQEPQSRPSAPWHDR